MGGGKACGRRVSCGKDLPETQSRDVSRDTCTWMKRLVRGALCRGVPTGRSRCTLYRRVGVARCVEPIPRRSGACQWGCRASTCRRPAGRCRGRARYTAGARHRLRGPVLAGASRGEERFSGRFNRVQVAGTDQALVAEDEALRAGVAEASAAEVLAPRVWIKGRGWGGLGLGSGSGFYRKYY